DLVVIGWFANDFEDVLVSDDAFRRSIGFGLPDPDGWPAWLKLTQLRAWAGLRLWEPARALLSGQPAAHDYYLANLRFLERARGPGYDGGAAAAADR
ncbi:hypothetical protein, partial [Streptomyces turgidiscabies]|uniref:hypothetical protein n=1 Tax=Streptomyces turgidiscabies TaxID=85558 RepID=UPI0038F81B98